VQSIYWPALIIFLEAILMPVNFPAERGRLFMVPSGPDMNFTPSFSACCSVSLALR
jgi:hypothetical protein